MIFKVTALAGYALGMLAQNEQPSSVEVTISEKQVPEAHPSWKQDGFGYQNEFLRPNEMNALFSDPFNSSPRASNSGGLPPYPAENDHSAPRTSQSLHYPGPHPSYDYREHGRSPYLAPYSAPYPAPYPPHGYYPPFPPQNYPHGPYGPHYGYWDPAYPPMRSSYYPPPPYHEGQKTPNASGSQWPQPRFEDRFMDQRPSPVPHDRFMDQRSSPLQQASMGSVSSQGKTSSLPAMSPAPSTMSLGESAQGRRRRSSSSLSSEKSPVARRSKKETPKAPEKKKKTNNAQAYAEPTAADASQPPFDPNILQETIAALLHAHFATHLEQELAKYGQEPSKAFSLYNIDFSPLLQLQSDYLPAVDETAQFLQLCDDEKRYERAMVYSDAVRAEIERRIEDAVEAFAQRAELPNLQRAKLLELMQEAQNEESLASGGKDAPASPLPVRGRKVQHGRVAKKPKKPVRERRSSTESSAESVKDEESYSNPPSPLGALVL